jgi:hypothetical protein
MRAVQIDFSTSVEMTTCDMFKVTQRVGDWRLSGQGFNYCFGIIGEYFQQHPG